MINIDNEKLIQKLYETCMTYYNWEKPYFIIESFNIVFTDDEIDSKDYSLFIKGRAGDDKNAQDTEISFEIQINPNWSYDFIQGYFYRELELGGVR